MAAKAGSIRVATQLVQSSARVLDTIGSARHDLYTCDGLFFPSMDAMAVATARGDESMARLLFSVSDPLSRREAIWAAARTDRLEILQLLVELGLSIHVRGQILNENNTLLVAAASGAAMRTGRWLLEVKHMPANAMEGVDPYVGEAPLSALYDFAGQVGVLPRVADFQAMLVQHGANVDALTSSQETLLAKAVLRDRQDMARLLLSAGAKPEYLDANERQALATLLAREIEPRDFRRQTEDCIDTASQ